jgi:dCTP deaminase
MMLLNDEKLCEYVTRNELVSDLNPPKDWFAKDSPVQPSSIDLHIGSIFLPGTKLGMDGSEDKPLSTHTLGPGEAAIVTTFETLTLPNNVAAIGFPPSSVSKQGLLTTNPGHVDPGYVGPMHFTVINMGRQEFPLRKGAIIVTLLFFEMSIPAKQGYATRNPDLKPGPPKQEDINKLSADFLDVTHRASDEANKEVAGAGLRLEQFKIRERTIIGIMTLLAACAGWFGSWVTGASELKARVIKLEQAQAVTESSLSLDRRITALENRLANPPTAKSAPSAAPGQGAATAPASKNH